MSLSWCALPCQIMIRAASTGRPNRLHLFALESRPISGADGHRSPMASLHEYFVRDARDLTTQQSFTISVAGSAIGEIIAKLHFDFHANAKYISFYIPAFDEMDCPEALALQKLPEILEWPATQVDITLRRGSEHIQGSSLVFTGRVYLYSERPISQQLKQPLEAKPKRKVIA